MASANVAGPANTNYLANLPTSGPVDLWSQASSTVQQDIASQTSPLKAQAESLAGREKAAIEQIGSMFDKLQPVVTGEADAVTNAYDVANNASRSIFEAAQQRMDQLAQGRAQSAQDLAQKMGGPVSVGEFMSGVEPARDALASIAPNQLLHGLANAQAGVQQARAFSGEVFPAMRTEQIANTRGYFEDQISQIQKQISEITSQSSSLTSARFQDLQKAEREYQLALANLKLDQLKSDRDWEATQRTLSLNQRKETFAEKQFKQTFGYTQKKDKATLKLATKKQQQAYALGKMKLSSQERVAASKLGLSVAQYKEQVRHHIATEKAATTRLGNQQQKNAMSILDHVTGRTQGPMSITRRRELDPAIGALQILSNPKISKVKDKQGKDHYYINENVTLTPAQVTRQYGSMGIAADPQSMYDTLLGSNVPAPVALRVVRMKSGVQSFTPNAPVRYTTDDLHRIANKSFQELVGIAKRRGWKPPVHDTKQKKNSRNTQYFIDYITSTNP